MYRFHYVLFYQRRKNMKNRLDFTTSSATVGSLWIDYRDGNLNLQPKYQRNYVWSDEFKSKLIYSLIRNYPIGSVTIRKLLPEQITDKYKSEVVDGQQRLTTIFNFIDNVFFITGDDARMIMNEVINQYSDYELKIKPVSKLINDYADNKKLILKYELLPERMRITLNNYNMAISTINQAQDVEVAEYFRFVQNQERLRAGEIINAFVDCPLDDVLEEKCNVNKLAEVLSIDNSRKEIHKAFYGVVGVLLDKLNFGCKDDDIINFAEKIDDINLDANVKMYAEAIALQLGAIASNCEPRSVKANRRMLKFIMLLSGLGLEDYNIDCFNKIKGLEYFNEKISSFNSAKKDAVKDSFDPKVFSPDDIENHRLVALISKGGHSRERVTDRANILIGLLNRFYYN